MNRPLKKLRRQFIITMMSIVTLFLVAIFSVQYFSSKKEMDQSSENALNIALDIKGNFRNDFSKSDRPDSPNSLNKPEDSSQNNPQNNSQNSPQNEPRPSDGSYGRMMDRFGDRTARRAVLVVNISSDGSIEPIRNDMFYMEDDYVTEVVEATPYKKILAEETSDSSDSDNSDNSSISDNSDNSNNSNNTSYKKSKSYKLSDYNLRYMLRIENGTTYIAYVDESENNSTLSSLLKRSLLISLGIFIIMLILSFYLSRKVLKPVEKAWNDQKRFVADASHELKTPLAVILSNTDMIIKSSDRNSEKNSRRLDNVKMESERMKELVQELLEVARGDIDKKESIKEDINLSELLNDELLVWDPVFFEAGKNLESDIEEDIHIQGDSTAIKRLYGILIDNALKYSDEKSTVNVSLKSISKSAVKSNAKATTSKHHSGSAHIQLQVSNKGTPLTKEQCQKIFERFYRTDASREDTPGYGLGLSIAEKIVQTHGGSITAESNGTDTNTFYVIL